MEAAFREAHRVLKPDAPLVCVYAHKTTLGWAALVEALRRAGFIDHRGLAARHRDARALDRSGHGVARLVDLSRRAAPRERRGVGSTREVVRDLDAIIAERLDRLTEAGVAGSDLIIAAIGAGLRAFTPYAAGRAAEWRGGAGRVVPRGGPVAGAERGARHRCTVLLTASARSMRRRVTTSFRGSRLATRRSSSTRRTTSRAALASSSTSWARRPRPLAEVKKDKVRLLDYSERGDDPELGLSGNGARQAPLIDVLHGLLWRAGHRREEMRDYLAAGPRR